MRNDTLLKRKIDKYKDKVITVIIVTAVVIGFTYLLNWAIKEEKTIKEERYEKRYESIIDNDRGLTIYPYEGYTYIRDTETGYCYLSIPGSGIVRLEGRVKNYGKNNSN